MTKDEALKMALNAMANKIESDYHGNPLTKYDEALQQAIDAGVEALATNKESSLVQPAQEVKDTIFSNYNENISKQVWNTKSGLEGTQFEITDDLK